MELMGGWKLQRQSLKEKSVLRKSRREDYSDINICFEKYLRVKSKANCI
jgi:hypothetical protein